MVFLLMSHCRELEGLVVGFEMTLLMTVEEIFANVIVAEYGCRIWQGATVGKGHGQVWSRCPAVC
jgi:hypothetical protein